MTVYEKIKEKRTILRGIYGGMMSTEELSRELRMKPEDAKEWARREGIENRIGTRIKYETDEVARIIVQRRGMV